MESHVRQIMSKPKAAGREGAKKFVISVKANRLKVIKKEPDVINNNRSENSK